MLLLFLIMASSAPSWCFSALRTLALTAAICSVFVNVRDEAGVRDWTMRNIGAVSFAAYHPSKGVVFAATDEHVLAGIDEDGRARMEECASRETDL